MTYSIGEDAVRGVVCDLVVLILVGFLKFADLMILNCLRRVLWVVMPHCFSEELLHRVFSLLQVLLEGWLGIKGQAVFKAYGAIGLTEEKIFVRVQSHTLAAYSGLLDPAFLAVIPVPELWAYLLLIWLRLGCWQGFSFHNAQDHAVNHAGCTI